MEEEWTDGSDEAETEEMMVVDLDLGWCAVVWDGAGTSSDATGKASSARARLGTSRQQGWGGEGARNAPQRAAGVKKVGSGVGLACVASAALAETRHGGWSVVGFVFVYCVGCGMRCRDGDDRLTLAPGAGPG